jgi:hypothetical protein
MVGALAFVIAAGFGAVPRSEVFPIERLDPPLRAEAETLLLKAMDREALYTIVGGLKPMSSGWLSLRTSVSKPDTAELTRLRTILRTFRVGDHIEAHLQPFWRVYGEDERYLDGVIFHRESMDAAIARHASLFGWFGVSAGSHPLEAVMAIDRDDTPRRNRGYGYFFGYPDYAVEFFTDSEEERRRTKQLVPRDFRSIPTFERESHAFVYAVPKGSEERPEDVALRKRAAPILRKYRELRAKYVGDGKPGIVALIRDWMDDGKGQCSPATAEAKAIAGK